MPVIPVVPTGAGGQAAVHTLTRTSTGGTWQIVLNGSASPPISGAATVTTAQVQSAIQAALGQFLGAGASGASAGAGITVAGNAGGPFTVTIPPNLVAPLDANAPLTLVTAALTGGTVTDVVAQAGQVASDALAGSDIVTPEPPHVVGTVGQPAFATGWTSVLGVSTTMLAGAPAAGARTDFQPLQYYFMPSGLVRVEGAAAYAAAAAGLIFTLPAGYRPMYTKSAPIGLAAAVGGLQVRPDGTVNYLGSTAGGGGLDVGLVEFRPMYI